MARAPPITLMTIVKKAPRNVTKAIDNSWVGQKMIDAGTQASGGIGGKTSNTGKVTPKKRRLTAMAKPSGMPITMAAKKPSKTRSVLSNALFQKLGSWTSLTIACNTAVGAGICDTQGKEKPNHACEREPASQKIRKTAIAPTPRQKSSPATKPTNLVGSVFAAAAMISVPSRRRQKP